ncbi:3-beta-hydroxysteroid-Delta(8),Delta(7)-isomerase [Ramicandelaber brevisporus]|nr:3-beta-hydroxysteroid-Delta(8),Delta(7)-isomerase [Ramicandelaber brevisporus]
MTSANVSAADIVDHPYYPRTVQLPHFVPNDLSVASIFATLSIPTATLLVIGWYLISSRRPDLSTAGRLTFCWFLISGLIHIVLEGYYVVHNRTIAGESFLLAQVWKEYSLSDSRYLTSDLFVLSMETVTAVFDGPLCYMAAYSMLNNLPHHHLFQALVSLAQIYGDVLYFATTMLEGSPHSDPHPYYYYFYFGFFNIIWIVIPTILLLQSCREIIKGMAALQREQAVKKSN